MRVSPPFSRPGGGKKDHPEPVEGPPRAGDEGPLKTGGKEIFCWWGGVVMAGPVVVLEIVSHRLDPSVIPRNQGNPSPRILGPSKGPPLTVIPAKAGISKALEGSS